MDDQDRPRPTLSRRDLLAATGTVAVGATAGCSQGGGNRSGTGGDDRSGTAGGTTTDDPTSAATSRTPTVTARPCDSLTPLDPPDVERGGTVSEGCYRAEETLVVESGTLTLEPGVTVEFASAVGLKVESGGRLRAGRAGAKPVVLTGAEETRGYWKGLYFRGSRSDDNVLENTVVQYAGGDSWNPNWENGGISLMHGSSLTVNGAVLRENGVAGILVRSDADALSVSGTRFEANALPAMVHPDVTGAFTPTCAFEDNDESAVRIGVGGNTVGSEQTWQHPGVPYHVNGTVNVEAPVRVAEGATFRFEGEEGLNVREEGQLVVEGTSEAPVRFTGREERAGSWRGIQYEKPGGGENLLAHAIVEYAGDSAWNPNHDPAGVFARGNGVVLSVRNATVRRNATMGVAVAGPKADLTVERSLFEDNAAPLLLPANLAGDVARTNAFRGNDESFVSLGDLGFGGADTAVVETTTWKALDVPYRATVTVVVEAPLEVAPGTTVAFEQDRAMRVRDEGRLRADGAGGDPIWFTGTEAVSGFWRGISFVSSLSTDNVLQNVVIENGGSAEMVGGGADDVANLFLHGGDRAAAVAISDSTVRGSGKYGIAIGNGEARLVDCDGLRFENNAGADTFNLETRGPISACQ